VTTYPFAGFWRRFIAYMIDGFILSVILIVFVIVAGVAYFNGAMSGSSRDLLVRLSQPKTMAMFTTWIWAFPLFMNIAYFTYFHGTTGRTPGKMLLGLQVVSANGEPISYGVAFLRSAGYFVSGFIFCLGYIWIGLDKRKQGWHDKIAGTVVIVREPEGTHAGIDIPDKSVAAAFAGGGAEPADIPRAEVQPADQPAGDAPSEGESQKIP
jgi:uncharacterized RDD family membrane protein YckC